MKNASILAAPCFAIALGLNAGNAAAFFGTAQQLANAMDIPATSISAASFSVLADPRAAAVLPDFAGFVPNAGGSLAVLSTGVAARPSDPGFQGYGNGFGTSNAPNYAFAFAVPPIFDYTELKLTLNAPANASGLSFNYNFISSEIYPFSVDPNYNDTFIAALGFLSPSLATDIALASPGHTMSVNNAIFTSNTVAGAATGWLTASASVAAGSTIQLRLAIFNVGDSLFNSTVLLDNFHWVSAVPEPDSYAILLAGLALIAFFARVRKHAAA